MIEFKCVDFLGNEFKIGDTLIISKTNKNLRVIKIAKIFKEENEYNRKLCSIVIEAEPITCKPLYNRGEEVTFTWTYSKYYKTDYYLKHPVKFNRVFKLC